MSQGLRETKVSLLLMLHVFVGPSRGSAQHYLRKSAYYPLALQTPALVVIILSKRSRMCTAVVFLFFLFFINLFLFYICSGNTVHSRRRKKERAKLKRNKIAYDPTMQR